MTETVIVALPSENDYVNRISSEKKPHLTLMYLGDNLDMDNLEQVVRYIQHIAKTSMHSFGLSVDRRGTLGDKDADVLFFEDGWQTENIQQIQGWLRADPHISKAYSQSKQYAKWIPHLTLGYPDTPANEDPREYPGTHYVNFDRIAIWTGDSEGPEFRLESNDLVYDMAHAHTEYGEAFADQLLSGDLIHYGVPGMQWGKRKDRPATGVNLKTPAGRKVTATGGKFEKASEDAKKAAERKQIAKKSSTDALSNTELKQLVERMQLEANYSRLVQQQQGNDIVKKLFTNKQYREQSLDNLANIRDAKAWDPIRAAVGVGNTIRKTDLSKIGY